MTRNASSRAPFVIAAGIALVPLVAIAPAAALGSTWRYLEYPRHISILALAIALLAMFRRRPALAIATPFLVALLAFLWEFVGEWRGLAKFGKTDLIFSELDILARYSVGRVAPWLVGGLAGALAYLAVTRAHHDKPNFIRAGAWLVVLAGACIAVTLANDGWVSHTSDGELHDFSSWPGPQKLALGASIAAGALGLAAIAFGLRRDKPPLPEARVHRG